MKLIYQPLLWFVIIFLHYNLTAYAQWLWQNPLPQGNNLNSVYYVNQNTGFLVGEAGSCLKTTDGGLTWTKLETNTNVHLTGLYFLNENLGIVVGGEAVPTNRNVILKTTDGGSSWNHQISSTPYPLYSVYMFDEQKYIIGGGRTLPNCRYTFLMTTNGGADWTETATGEGVINKMKFINNNTGWAVGGNQTLAGVDNATIIMKSTNGGLNWFPQNTSTVKVLHNIDILNPDTLFAAGNGGLILCTTNGGNSWNSKPSGTTYALKDIDIYDKTMIAVTGDLGLIFISTDFGSSWNQSASGVNFKLNEIVYLSKNSLWIVGSSGTILSSTNGGTNWINQQSSVSNENLFKTSFFDLNNGMITGTNGTILKTSNGGLSWISLSSGTIQALWDVSYPSINVAYAVGIAGIILKTTNAGESWVQLNSGTGETFQSVYFINENLGYAVGSNGIVLKTTNGGSTFVQQNSGTNVVLTGVSFADANAGIAVGLNGASMLGTVIRTTNGGELWETTTQGLTQNFYMDIKMVNKNVAYLVGAGPNTLKTTDGGITWTLLANGTGGVFTPIYRAVDFIDVNRGAVVGGEGVCYITTDGGESWSYSNTTTRNFLYGISFINDSLIYVAGEQGVVMKLIKAIVPVEFESLTAVTENNNVVLQWSTATETNNRGFEIEKKNGSGDWYAVGFQPGNGTTTEPKSYSFLDNDLPNGNYSYRIKQVDFSGRYSYSSEIDVSVSYIPDEFELLQNYPNPFNPVTTIRFSVPVESNIKISVFNITGELVEKLMDEIKPAGTFECSWDAGLYSSGIYFYRIDAESVKENRNYKSGKKMILLK